MGRQKPSTEPGAGLCGGCSEKKECEHPLLSPGASTGLPPAPGRCGLALVGYKRGHVTSGV